MINAFQRGGSDSWVPEEYDKHLQAFLDRGTQQKFHISTWKVHDSWVNPSIIMDPSNKNNVIMVWRMPDKGRKDKIGYMWLDRKFWNITKPKDMIGK